MPNCTRVWPSATSLRSASAQAPCPALAASRWACSRARAWMLFICSAVRRMPWLSRRSFASMSRKRNICVCSTGSGQSSPMARKYARSASSVGASPPCIGVGAAGRGAVGGAVEAGRARASELRATGAAAARTAGFGLSGGVWEGGGTELRSGACAVVASFAAIGLSAHALSENSAPPSAVVHR